MSRKIMHYFRANFNGTDYMTYEFSFRLMKRFKIKIFFEHSNNSLPFIRTKVIQNEGAGILSRY